MATGFQKAVRSRRKLKIAVDGPPGSGKTFSMIRLGFSIIAAGLGSRMAVIDTEKESASLYAGECPDGTSWEFDTLQLSEYGPDRFTNAINLAIKSGYDVILIDSLSHAWVGEGGALDIVDAKGGNKFAAWKDVTPMHRGMVDAIVHANAHILVTMRSKVEYVMEEDVKGKMVPRKVGVAPVQRDGMEYEFDVYGSVDWSHQLKISKSRCSAMQDRTTVKPGPDFWRPLFDWLQSAGPSAPPPPRPAEAFATAIDTAETLEDLNKVGPDIKTAFDTGRITAAERQMLVEKFKARKTKLTADAETHAAMAAATKAKVAADAAAMAPAVAPEPPVPAVAQ